MASAESLINYYDTLKDSFNKIQVKDNKTALVNAALRPKIREEFVKSRDVLKSYLNYIQVFTFIYSDKFANICSTIICPIFKEVKPKRSPIEDESGTPDAGKSDDSADQIHETMREILKSKPELSEEYIHCINKIFPTVFDRDDTFSIFLANCLEVCTYVKGEPLTNLIMKMLDRINPPPPIEADDEDAVSHRKIAITRSYEMVFKYLDGLEDEIQIDQIVKAVLNSFTKEFLASEHEDQLNYLILYVCSKKPELSDLFIDDLWSVFTNNHRSYEERRSSVLFTCSFLSRANFVDLDRAFKYLVSASNWCREMLADIAVTSIPGEHQTDSANENYELFYDLVQSMLYLITQRYREMYEKDALVKLVNLNLGPILDNKLKPISVCDTKILQRFQEVVTLLKIPNLKEVLVMKEPPLKKRRKSSHEFQRLPFRIPFGETDKSVPDRVKPVFRNYYDHRNFTIFRE